MNKKAENFIHSTEKPSPVARRSSPRAAARKKQTETDKTPTENLNIPTM